MTPLVFLGRLGAHRSIRRGAAGKTNGGQFAAALALLIHPMRPGSWPGRRRRWRWGGIIECLLAGGRMPFRSGALAQRRIRAAGAVADTDRGPSQPEQPRRGAVGPWRGCEGGVLRGCGRRGYGVARGCWRQCLRRRCKCGIMSGAGLRDCSVPGDTTAGTDWKRLGVATCGNPALRGAIGAHHENVISLR